MRPLQDAYRAYRVRVRLHEDKDAALVDALDSVGERLRGEVLNAALRLGLRQILEADTDLELAVKLLQAKLAQARTAEVSPSSHQPAVSPPRAAAPAAPVSLADPLPSPPPLASPSHAAGNARADLPPLARFGRGFLVDDD